MEKEIKLRVSDCNVHVKYTKRPSDEYEIVKALEMWYREYLVVIQTKITINQAKVNLDGNVIACGQASRLQSDRKRKEGLYEMATF